MPDESLRRPARRRRARGVPRSRRDPPVPSRSSAAQSSTLRTVPPTRLDSVSGRSPARGPRAPPATTRPSTAEVQSPPLSRSSARKRRPARTSSRSSEIDTTRRSSRSNNSPSSSRRRTRGDPPLGWRRFVLTRPPPRAGGASCSPARLPGRRRATQLALVLGQPVHPLRQLGESGAQLLDLAPVGVRLAAVVNGVPHRVACVTLRLPSTSRQVVDEPLRVIGQIPQQPRDGTATTPGHLTLSSRAVAARSSDTNTIHCVRPYCLVPELRARVPCGPRPPIAAFGRFGSGLQRVRGRRSEQRA